MPDGVEDGQHVGPRNSVDGPVQQRLGVPVERIEPFSRMALVAPTRLVQRVDGGRSFSERRDAGDALGRWSAVAARSVGSQLGGPAARAFEADGGVGAESDVTALAVDGDSGDPGTTAGRLDDERQSVPVRVLAGRCIFDLGCGESAGRCHSSGLSVPPCPPKRWGTPLPLGERTDKKKSIVRFSDLRF